MPTQFSGVTAVYVIPPQAPPGKSAGVNECTASLKSRLFGGENDGGCLPADAARQGN